MLKNVLIPLDGSTQAERAIPMGTMLARLTSSGIILLRVVPEPVPAPEVAGAPIEIDALEGGLHASNGEEEHAVRDYLDTISKRLSANGLDVDTELVQGDPATDIVDYAETHAEVWLIAMATSHWGSRSFGSVAEKVLQTTLKPVLLTRPQERTEERAEESVTEPALRMIIVPLDGSAFAEHALEHATEIAQRTGARLALVCASAPSDNMGLEDVELMRLSADVSRDYQAMWLRRYLAETAEHLRAGGLDVLTELVYGHPAEMILLAAHRLGGDLIVMAAHRRQDPARLWLGSVGQRVVQGSTLPVLLLLPQPQAEGYADLLGDNLELTPR
jgi:nucleotide-binding universal stress UspA family protein